MGRYHPAGKAGGEARSRERPGRGSISQLTWSVKLRLHTQRTHGRRPRRRGVPAGRQTPWKGGWRAERVESKMLCFNQYAFDDGTDRSNEDFLGR